MLRLLAVASSGVLVAVGCAGVLGIDDWSAGPDATSTSGAGGADPGSCTDGVKNGAESDVDCGGECPSCAAGAGCETDGDCATGHCAASTCCTDACEGGCRACAEALTKQPDGACAPVVAGSDPADACSGEDVCDGAANCRCDNGVKDGSEAGVDCGPPCGACVASCGNGQKNAPETDVDCGGGTCPKCVDGKTCTVDGDCVGGACTGGLCCTPELPSTTCANGCGASLQNNCGQVVDCHSTCAPAVPAGWSGPYIVGVGANAPACSGKWGTTVLTAGVTLAAPPASCGACACGSVGGATCGGVTLSIFSDTSCNQVVATAGVPSNQCAQTVAGVAQSAKAFALLSSPGTCPASGGAATIPAADFTESGTVCAGPSPGPSCGAGICVPEPLPGFSAACISKPGDVACVAGFPTKTVLYAGVSDTRGCSACACAAPVGGSCQGNLQIYSDTSCSLTEAIVPVDGVTCEMPGGNFDVASELTAVGPVGGVCAHSGGAPVGQATPTSPTTVCCAP